MKSWSGKHDKFHWVSAHVHVYSIAVKKKIFVKCATASEKHCECDTTDMWKWKIAHFDRRYSNT